MPKAKGKTRRQKFGYNVNRKTPRIECSHIQHAWDHAKSVRQNLAEMGLAMDPNKAVPLQKRKVKAMEVDIEERPKELVRKPYVLNDLEAEASLPEKKGNTLSRDLIDYVHYMVENNGEDKAMHSPFYRSLLLTLECLGKVSLPNTISSTITIPNLSHF
uniref:Nucleolar protein 16 n=1 Tax=Canis lupus familiaris TaxID=9615 RepID=A0A8C0NP77_CANLF